MATSLLQKNSIEEEKGDTLHPYSILRMEKMLIRGM